MSTVIDEFFVAIGLKVDATGAQQLKQQTDAAKSHLFSLGNAVKAFATGFVAKSIADINSSFEQNRIQIAGFLNALNLAPSFTTGLTEADGIIQKIITDAARLPGEAEEYIEVFKSNAAFLKTAMPGADAGQIAAFTNRLTAVAKTVASTMDAGQIARESGMLLGAQGRAGTHNVLWQKLMPFLMQVDGQAKITAQSFNAMTQPKRVELLNKAFDKLQPALDAASDTFDAMWGAAVSGARQFVRAATPGLFKGLKTGIAAVTGMFIDGDGKLTAFGESIAHLGRDIGTFVTRTLRMVFGLSKALFHLVDSSVAAKGALVGIGVAIVGLERVLTFGLLGAFILVAEDLYTFYEGGQSVVGLLAQKFPWAVGLVEVGLGVLGAAFVATQAAAVTAGIETAAAWTIANLPIVLMIASLGVLAAAIVGVIKHWDEFKTTVKFLPRLAAAQAGDAITNLFGGHANAEEQVSAALVGEVEGLKYRKSGKLLPGAEGPAFRPELLGGNKAEPVASPAYGHYLHTLSEQNKSVPETAADRPNVNQSNHITINTTDGASGGRAAAREIVRGTQKAYR